MSPYSVHLWRNGQDRGRVSCLLNSFNDAERWISQWRSVGSKFQSDDLRVHNGDGQATNPNMEISA